MKTFLRLARAAAAVAILAAALPALAEKIVVQVSDGAVPVWNQALNVVQNLRTAYGPDTQIDVVAFGQGIKMLTFDSQVAARVDEAQKKLGARFYACENSMQKNQLKREDMASDLVFVPAGVEHIIGRVREGWVLIRP